MALITAVLLLTFVCLLSKSCDASETPGGPYGLAKSPFMGWRSWNAFHNDINQDIIQEVVDAMVKPQADGRSLLSLGFKSVGLDDAWQGFNSGQKGSTACQVGHNGTFHDDNGKPLWAKATFPDPKGMVAYAHERGLQAGWYGNNCQCKEVGQTNVTWIQSVYEQTVAMLVDQEWDSIKLDGCSQFHNTSLWANLLEKTGRPVAIENCNNGHRPDADGNPDWADHDGQCPYNWFRTSGDIQPDWGHIMNNLGSVTQYQDIDRPLSRPGCWAYPDMLEVGNLPSFEEDRSHFGAWCVVSSPLVLGYDVRNENKTAAIWTILSNEKAVAVNQQWAGHPGRLVKTWNVNNSAGSDDLTHADFSLWLKPQPKGENAIFLLSNQGTKVKTNVTIDLEELGHTSRVSVVDIWGMKKPFFAFKSFVTNVGGHDSRFFLLTPA